MAYDISTLHIHRFPPLNHFSIVIDGWALSHNTAVHSTVRVFDVESLKDTPSVTTPRTHSQPDTPMQTITNTPTDTLADADCHMNLNVNKI